jgi:hypothetical protein
MVQGDSPRGSRLSECIAILSAGYDDADFGERVRKPGWRWRALPFKPPPMRPADAIRAEYYTVLCYTVLTASSAVSLSPTAAKHSTVQACLPSRATPSTSSHSAFRASHPNPTHPPSSERPHNRPELRPAASTSTAAAPRPSQPPQYSQVVPSSQASLSQYMCGQPSQTFPVASNPVPESSSQVSLAERRMQLTAWGSGAAGVARLVSALTPAGPLCGNEF